MTITDFFHEAPILAAVISLGYATLLGAFAYMFVRMYRK
jgi:hypothetical protein